MLSPDLLTSRRQTYFLRLLYQSLQADFSTGRGLAMLKRLLQIALNANPSFQSGALIVVSELLRLRPALRAAIHTSHSAFKPFKASTVAADSQPESAAATSSADLGAAAGGGGGGGGDSDIEHFADLEAPSDFPELPAAAEEQSPDNRPAFQSKGIAALSPPSAPSAPSAPSSSSKPKNNLYDFAAADPNHANGEFSSLWELCALARSFHPSVSKFAETILSGNFIEYKSDPMQDFSLASFLSRFSYRQPKLNKKSTSSGGASPLTPLSRKHRSDVRSDPPVNSVDFLARAKANRLEAHDAFYFRYFSRKAEQESEAKKKTEEEGSKEEEEEEEEATGGEKSNEDEDEVEVDKEDEDELDKALADESDAEDEDLQKAKKDFLQQVLEDGLTDDEQEEEGEEPLKPKDKSKESLEPEPDQDDEVEPPGIEEDGIEGNHHGGERGDEDDDDDEEDGFAGFGDDLDSDDEDGDESDQDAEGGSLAAVSDSLRSKYGKGSKGSAQFADADEFASLLEQAGTDGLHPKEQEYISKVNSGFAADRRKRSNYHHQKASSNKSFASSHSSAASSKGPRPSEKKRRKK